MIYNWNIIILLLLWWGLVVAGAVVSLPIISFGHLHFHLKEATLWLPAWFIVAACLLYRHYSIFCTWWYFYPFLLFSSIGLLHRYSSVVPLLVSSQCTLYLINSASFYSRVSWTPLFDLKFLLPAYSSQC